MVFFYLKWDRDQKVSWLGLLALGHKDCTLNSCAFSIVNERRRTGICIILSDLLLDAHFLWSNDFFFNSLIYDDFYLEGEPYKVVIRNSLKDGEYPTKYLLEWETPKNGGADIDRIEICHRRVCFGCNNQGSDLQQNLPLMTSLCLNFDFEVVKIWFMWIWYAVLGLIHRKNMTQKKPWHIAYSIMNYNMCFKMHTIKASIISHHWRLTCTIIQSFKSNLSLCPL